MAPAFTPSRPWTVGVELELQLLDAGSLALRDGILPLMDLFPNNPHIKPEFIQNTVEIATPVCRDIGELERALDALCRALREKCAALDMTLCGAGTHPFDRRLALITPLPRYRKIERESGLISHLQVTFATHVHVGVASGDQAVTVMRRLKSHLPVLIALSANSPYWRGYDTGFCSYRHRILAAARSYGIPPSFDDWSAFQRFFDAAHRAGAFHSIHDIHWDIRPRPHYGTVEVRVMDAQSSVADAVTLAGLVRALVWRLARLPADADAPGLPRPLPWWLEKENHFQASRLGLAASFIHHPEGGTRPLAEVARDVIAACAEADAALGQADQRRRLEALMAEGPGYARQRALYGRGGDFRALVRALAARLAGAR